MHKRISDVILINRFHRRQAPTKHNQQPKALGRWGKWCAAPVLLLSLCGASAAERPLDRIDTPDDSVLYQVTADGGRYTFLEQQIFRGEQETALTQLDADIEQIETARHRYHEDLIVPLTLSGDALVVQREYGKALDRYERARHVARVSTGLFARSQLPVVYREADVYRRMGDLKSSAQREEYAYEIAKKAFGEYSLESLPTLYRLASFYLETYNYLSARSLYNRALATLEQNGLGEAEAAIPALQGIAVSHRLARFPPFYVHSANDNSRFDGPTPALTTSDLEDQHIAFNNFPAGEKALQRIIDIRQNTAPDDMEAIAQAITALGDWHMLFGRSQAANLLYKFVVQEVDGQGPEVAADGAEQASADTKQDTTGSAEDNGAQAAEATSAAVPEPAAADESETPALAEAQPGRYNNPTLIYFPVPNDPTVPKNASADDGEEGFVTLNFHVGPTGRVRKLRTVESQPPKLMDFRVRRSMRQAVFRPRLENGVAVVAEDHSFTHRFTYFPKGLTPEQREDIDKATARKAKVNTDREQTPADTHSDAALPGQQPPTDSPADEQTGPA